MKTSKRLVLLALALVLTFAFASQAMAATISLDPDSYTGHTFKSYQIFTGTSTDDAADQQLNGIGWGSGVNPTSLITALKAKYTDNTAIQALTTDPVSTAAAVAAAISSLNADNDSAAARELALLVNGCTTGAGTEITTTTTNLPDGYYLIKDETANLGNEVQNLPLLQVTGNIVIKEKVEKPELHKKILHDDPNEWGIVGDNQIGDDVQFKVTSKVPDVSPFTTYTFVIHDEMSKGLVLNADSFAVKIGAATLEAANYTYTAGTAGADGSTSFTLAFNDAKTLFTDHAGEDITVTYSAKLTEDVGKLLYKEQNKAYLEYSTKHDDSGKGETTPDVVTDYSFSIPVKKVDGAAYDAAADKEAVESLAGAKFQLKDGNTDAANVIKFKQDATDANKYIVDPNGTVTEIETNANGKFYICGLNDATTYYLYETQAPVGYNAITEPITMTITATYDENGLLTGLTATAGGKNLTYTVENGAVTGGQTLIIENNSGTHLPETGGIGTTIFYVGGALLMLAAIAVLVARRKMAAK